MNTKVENPLGAKTKFETGRSKACGGAFGRSLYKEAAPRGVSPEKHLGNPGCGAPAGSRGAAARATNGPRLPRILWEWPGRWSREWC